MQYDAENKYMHIPNSKLLEVNKEPELNIVYYAGSKDNLKWGLNWMKDNLLELNEFLSSPDNLYDYIYTEDVHYRWVYKVIH